MKKCVFFLITLILLTVTDKLLAQGTAFTYQGRLNAGGSSANGNYDFTFGLFTGSSTNSGQLGSTLTLPDVGVTNGLFAVTLDFGANFPGSNRWLAIGVRTNGGASFTALTPLQPLTPTPYAIFANTASNVVGVVSSASLSGTYSGAVTLNNAGNNFSGNYSGNGANVTNVNAAALNGLRATNFWQTSGNTVAVGQFLGSTNNQPVELWVNGGRALRLEPTITVPNIIGGFPGNLVDSGAQGATIGGGGTAGFVNHISSTLATVAGGSGHLIETNANDSTIGGGRQNEIDSASWGTFIGGGQLNLVQSNSAYSVIGGGSLNRIETNAQESVIGGGGHNFIEIYAACSTIGGGLQNTIQGDDNRAANNQAYGGFIGGGAANTIETDSYFSIIGGGAFSTILPNCSYGTLAGGYSNTIGGAGSFIGGGGYDGATFTGNTAMGNAATIGGGLGNTIPTNGVYAFIGGGYNNIASDAIAAVGGGYGNNAGGESSFIGGGVDNTIPASGAYAFIGSGHNNIASGEGSFIGGGAGDTIPASGDFAFIGGGYSNIASGEGATVSGGQSNIASGPYASVAGGYENIAQGESSFAAGNQAQALHTGAFVWADSLPEVFASTGDDQFLIRAEGNVGINTTTPGSELTVVQAHQGGRGAELSLVNNSGSFVGNEVAINFGTDNSSYDGDSGNAQIKARLMNTDNRTDLIFSTYNGSTFGERMRIQANGFVGIGAPNPGMLLQVGMATCNGQSWLNTSDRNLKEGFAAINARSVLEKVSAMPITEWKYKAEAEGTEHIGPMAQDFHAAFGLNGTDDKRISTVDESGVALAAIQGLNQKVESENSALRAENSELKQRLEALEKIVFNQKSN